MLLEFLCSYTNTHMFVAEFFLNDSLHFILRYTVTANTMIKVTIVTQTRDMIIVVELVIDIIVEEAHSSSLKEAINTGQEDLTLKICDLIFIVGPLATHCCNICTRSSAATCDVPWTCALYVTNFFESAKHWNPPFVIAVFISILHWHCSINNVVM